MKKTSISTIIGLIIGVSCVVYGIAGSPNPKLFWNAPSFFIIIGATLGAVIVAYPPHQLKNLGSVLLKSFKKEKYDFTKDINALVEISKTARSKGLLALEGIASEYENDDFLHKGLLLLADGVAEDTLINSLKSEIYYATKRHKQGIEMVNMIAGNVTALGLLGTYVGLIPMLNDMSDPETLGPMMALELVSSFYGAFLAYTIFTPIGKRLQAMSSMEVFRKELIMEGIVLIQNGKPPRLIEEQLLATLRKKEINKKFIKTKAGMNGISIDKENSGHAGRRSKTG